MNNKKILILIIFNISIISYGQDLHLSQFFNSITTLNPSMIGVFSGDFRVIGNYRSQWNSIVQNPFKTSILTVDSKNFLGGKNLGLGLNLYDDRVGAANLHTQKMEPSISYHIPLDFEKNKIMSIGFQFSWNFKSIDYNNLSFDNQFINNRFSPNNPTNENLTIARVSYFNSNIGVSYYEKISVHRKLIVGIALNNVFNPDISFFKDKDKLYRKFVLHGLYEFELIPSVLNLCPKVLFIRQGKNTEIIIGSSAIYMLENNDFKRKAVYLGLYSRIVDAAIIYFGFEYNQWIFGYSYDLNYSTLKTATNLRGAYEFSLSYRLKNVLKKPSLYRSCPSFI